MQRPQGPNMKARKCWGGLAGALRQVQELHAGQKARELPGL